MIVLFIMNVLHLLKWLYKVIKLPIYILTFLWYDNAIRYFVYHKWLETANRRKINGRWLLMALEHFYNYLNAYSETYYSKYILDLEPIGDSFCAMKSDADLQIWLDSTDCCGFHPYQKNLISTPAIVIQHEIDYDKNALPAYAVALKEFFYKEYPYPECKNSPSERTRITKTWNTACHHVPLRAQYHRKLEIRYAHPQQV